MEQFKTSNDELLIGGVGVKQLVSRVGQTPFYAYDRSVMDNKVALLREALPKSIKLHYAIKANPMPDVIQHMAEIVDGLDVASGKELRLAMNTKMPATDISFAGPGKTELELQMAIASEIVINVESEQELERIAAISQSLAIKANVAIRVNPNFELKTSGMKMGGGSQQFGVDSEAVPALVGKVQQYGLTFQGFHIFTGSQNLQAKALIEAHDNIFHLTKELAFATKAELKAVNIGGGFGIPYFPGEKVLQLDEVSKNLELLLAEFMIEFFKVFAH